MVKIRKGTIVAVLGTAIPAIGYGVASKSVNTMVAGGCISPVTGVLANTTTFAGASTIAAIAIKTGAEMNYLEEEYEKMVTKE